MHGPPIKPKIASTPPPFAAHHAAASAPMPDHTNLLVEARRYAQSLGVPGHTKLRVCVKIADTSEKILDLLSIPPSEPAANERTGVPPLGAKQKRILVALLAGPMKGDALAKAVDLQNRSSLYSGRGLKQLVEWGLIENDETDGFILTEFGEDMANEINDG